MSTIKRLNLCLELDYILFRSGRVRGQVKEEEEEEDINEEQVGH